MGRKCVDRTGHRYGRLVVLRPAPAERYMRWHCACDCGGTAIVRGDFLREGWTKSCGCLRRENAREQGRKYGGKNKREGALTYTFAALAECMP